MVLTSSSGIGASSSSASLIRGTEDLGKAIEAKMDSISRALEADSKENSDSLAKAKADSVRSALKAGNYVGRAQYDKSNFDSWKIDTVYQKSMKEKVSGDWRTPILSHGHAFRDAALTFQMNDTLVGTTRTYSDSGRYQMTGEYTYRARYRFQDDSTIVTREVFKDRGVVRWDFIQFKIDGKKFLYHLKKIEFRDLNDNWLNALQGFDKVDPETYLKVEGSNSNTPKSVLQVNAK
ncbi:hypothetical protein [Hallerella succinigenes]|nr:hypothetical protein [Hallerella succinigenes]MDD6091133.1 hypothetical protein [Hallerella succinigenes]MDY5029979.1 hypothetical protein [Hallerella succinigenes]